MGHLLEKGACLLELQNIPYPWQTSHWHSMVGLVQQQTLPHALLLTGPQGMGKRQFALALATLILCEQPGEKACGACSSCHLMQAQTHPDFFLIEPEAESSVIKIDQIRDLFQPLSQRALKGHYKVIVIHPAEGMNTAASNALLKQLEEPFPNTVFLVVSHHPARLLPTVLSRCQRLRFYTDFTPEVERWLALKLSTKPSLHLWNSYPAPFQLIEAVSQGWPEKRQQFFGKLLEMKSHIAVVEEAETISQTVLLSWMIQLVGDCIRLHCGQNAHFLDPRHLVILEQKVPALSLKNCYRVLQYYAQRQEDLSRQVNLSNSLWAFSLIIPWVSLYQQKEVKYLMEAV